ncbi:hypothetical protein GCM10010406_07130 [Streptomyces thermolineatus]|uniref:Transcriptional regulator n=1 Tax=Streptomyces thermolineatus TaxID=44033 RepID=A0ABN3KX54_9ACTN
MGKSIDRASSHPLAFVRRRRGWSYQELARVVADNARALGVPMAARREKVWRWEHWGVVPEADSQRALARALGVPAERLESHPWPDWLPAHSGVPTGRPWTGAGSLAALAELADDAGADPRGYPLVTGSALVEALAEWRTAVAGRSPRQPPGPPGPVDAVTVHWAQESVTGLRRLEDRLGSGAVRHRVEADLGLVRELLHRGTREPRLRTELFRTAADLAHLGGWVCTDTARHGPAQRFFLTGLRLAHTAGDRPLAANLLAGLSLQAVLAGRPSDALAAADAAREAASGRTCARVRSMVATRRARSHALLGDERACRRALEEARRLLERAGARGGNDPAWIYYFDESELAGQAGSALLDLGLPAEAATLLEGARAVRAAEFPRDRAVYAARAAVAHARCGNRERAGALAEEAARTALNCVSPGATAALEQARAALDEAAALHGGGAPLVTP